MAGGFFANKKQQEQGSPSAALDAGSMHVNLSSPVKSPLQLSAADANNMTRATGFELPPLTEAVIALAKEQEQDCKDLEEDINDFEAELVEVYDDIEQDKLDCKFYEDLLAQKEEELEQRRIEVEEMHRVNHQRQVDLHAREDLSLIHISEPTRLLSISYAVFCLKKKKKKKRI
eukprot:TRINITY_DN3160_c0_g1_i1.p1 TRINITY_DN3160_c0_g1~~TRINITY_DN3160_c0_g1_i1.p1  ORF type:complete len:174 (-),score=83.67 TRINITY_DN3160_c0_g1_i1:67-588(-)